MNGFLISKQSPRYVPAMGTTGFWHNGTYFRVNRKKESFMNTSGWSAMKDLEEIKISCFGRSIGKSPLFTKAALRTNMSIQIRSNSSLQMQRPCTILIPGRRPPSIVRAPRNLDAMAICGIKSLGDLFVLCAPSCSTRRRNTTCCEMSMNTFILELLGGMLLVVSLSEEDICFMVLQARERPVSRLHWLEFLESTYTLLVYRI